MWQRDQEVLKPPKCTPNEVPADVEGGRRASTSAGTAPKKATAFGQACGRSVGGGTSWLRQVECNPANADADQKRRRSKHDKIKKSSSPSSNGEARDPSKCVPQRTAIPAGFCGLDQEFTGILRIEQEVCCSRESRVLLAWHGRIRGLLRGGQTDHMLSFPEDCVHVF